MLFVGGNSRDRKILRDKIAGAITRVFVEGLRLLETNIEDKDLFRQLRQRMLQVGNDQINYVDRLLDRYQILYKPVGREVIARKDTGGDK
ncbi:MAG: hypothetical protein AB7E45_02140 [Candidatus Caldatribacteriota bacterium]